MHELLKEYRWNWQIKSFIFVKKFVSCENIYSMNERQMWKKIQKEALSWYEKSLCEMKNIRNCQIIIQNIHWKNACWREKIRLKENLIEKNFIQPWDKFGWNARQKIEKNRNKCLNLFFDLKRIHFDSHFWKWIIFDH